MRELIFSILNIRISESKYVFDLLKVQFFIGLANALINIVAFTLFIHTFAITGLAYAFLGIAFFLLLINLMYEKLEQRFTPIQLLRSILIASLFVFLAFWSGLVVAHSHVFIYCILICSTLFYMITSYAFWGIVSLLFNIRESKRVFSIVGSGDIPAKLIGYAATPLLIPITGVPNLLLLAVVFMGTAFILLNRLAHKSTWQSILRRAHAHTQHHTESHPIKKGRIEAFFRSELIFSISLLSILSYNVFVLIDYTFISQVKSRFYDLTNLAAFIAQFFAFGRIIALVLKLTFSSRAIERLGIIACLSFTPVTLFLFSCTFFFTYDVTYTVFIFGIMALLTEVLRSTIQEPVFLILFQPLSEHLRLKGHIIAKGYMFPISLVVVGLSLILFPVMGLPFTIMTTIKVLLVNLVVWAVIIFMIKKAYVKVLHYSIQKGVYNGEDLKVSDHKTIELLLKKVEEGKDVEIIYALKLLESASYQDLDELLKKQLYSPLKEVKKYALFKLEEREQLDVTLLHDLLATEEEREVKERIVDLLCQLDASFLKTISGLISQQDYATRKIIIHHLLSQKEFSFLYTASKEIHSLITSPFPKEREQALEIISELSDIKFTDAIEVLLEDNEPAIRRSAIIAACRLHIQKLLPVILQLLKEQPTKYLALHGLQVYGDVLFNDIKTLPTPLLSIHKQELIKIAGKSKGTHSTAYLLSQLSDAPDNNDRIIHALWMKSYVAETPEQMHQFKPLLKYYIKNGFEKIAYCKEVPLVKGYHLIRQSLLSEIESDVTTALKLCIILYHNKEINRLLELVAFNKNNKLFNAMEMLEWTLPKKLSMQINSLIDFVLEPTFNKRTAANFDPVAFLNKVLVVQSQSFNIWTKAVCIYCSIENQQSGVIRELNAESDLSNHYIINETRAYALQAI
ncbi:MFS transporter [Flavisolibacter tropicus]|uniref:ADP,ATP carrier protein n=1 Tax=Flavisolibacter tropicus TaxID=1492898 RepID=A0A172TRL9_9BACT|nr:MFS transporter [Flavisolibacter tropicus]ANE49646.1 hypothetical protein SY85_03125 [Flavisolibacter tropicus]